MPATDTYFQSAHAQVFAMRVFATEHLDDALQLGIVWARRLERVQHRHVRGVRQRRLRAALGINVRHQRS